YKTADYFDRKYLCRSKSCQCHQHSLQRPCNRKKRGGMRQLFFRTHALYRHRDYGKKLNSKQQLLHLIDNLVRHTGLAECRHLSIYLEPGLDHKHGESCPRAFTEPEVQVKNGLQSHLIKHCLMAYFNRVMCGKQVVTDLRFNGISDESACSRD